MWVVGCFQMLLHIGLQLLQALSGLLEIGHQSMLYRLDRELALRLQGLFVIQYCYLCALSVQVVIGSVLRLLPCSFVIHILLVAHS